MRNEELKFNLKLNKTKAEKYAEAIKCLLKKEAPEIDAGDTLTLTYTLLIDYWGDVVERIKALKQILDDPDVVVAVSTEELIHGQCLIKELFDQLTVITNKLKG
jgi:hypothetical protein